MSNILFISRKDSREKPALFTPWSISHFFSGIVLFLFFNIFTDIKNSIILTLIIHTIYEIKDYYYCYIINTFNNSFTNSIGDTICCILGIYFVIILKKNNKIFCNTNKCLSLLDSMFFKKYILLWLLVLFILIFGGLGGEHYTIINKEQDI
jgi:hypothetical protein